MNTIQLSTAEGMAWLSLNRPEVFNSFNREMALQLQQLLDQCESNPEVKVICLTGTGKAFCAGQDLGEATDPEGPAISTIVKEHYNPIILRLRNIKKPVVAAVNGVAAGAGANIALACDIVVAKESASFIQAFSKIGLIPDSGGTFMLPRLVGFQKALALMMTGDKLSAADAERMGMIYKVFSDDQFDAESRKLVRNIAAMPLQALVYTKEALNGSGQHSLQQQLELEAVLQEKCAETEDFKEGVQAFLEKRKPNFK